MKRPEAPTRTRIDAQPSGIEGYVTSMKRYPEFCREQTEAALFALRNRQNINELRNHALFKPHLEQEERDLLKSEVYHASPVRSYRQLFADSPTIGHLVAFGNFSTIRHWVQEFQTTYHGIPLDLEEFMQDALDKIAPDAARSYVPLHGASFTTYLSNLLIWRLDTLVDGKIRQRSMFPAGVQKGKPKLDTRRMSIESLDAPLSEETDNGEAVSLYDIVEHPNAPAPGAYLERSDALHALLKQAGITRKEAQVLQTYIIEGESQDYTASMYGVTLRAIRSRRDRAIAQFRTLGIQTVVDILNGDTDVNPQQRR